MALLVATVDQHVGVPEINGKARLVTACSNYTLEKPLLRMSL